jgi:hypothetical protein
VDDFSYLPVLIFRHSRSRRYTNFEGVPRNFAVADTDSHLLTRIAWAALLLLICVQSWWAMFELRHYQPWTFAAFAVVLLQTILTYMLAGLVFPDLWFPLGRAGNRLQIAV